MKIKRFNEMNEKFNLNQDIFSEIVFEIEDSYNWDYIEHEGRDRVRFDWGDNSLWVNIDNTFDGNVPNSEVKMILRNRGLVSALDEGIFSDRYKNDDFDDTPHVEYRNLVNELQNVTQRYQIHMDADDIKKALLEIVDIYDEESSDRAWNR